MFFLFPLIEKFGFEVRFFVFKSSLFEYHCFLNFDGFLDFLCFDNYGIENSMIHIEELLGTFEGGEEKVEGDEDTVEDIVDKKGEVGLFVVEDNN